MLNQDSAKKAQECETIEKTQENEAFWRPAGMGPGGRAFPNITEKARYTPLDRNVKQIALVHNWARNIKIWADYWALYQQLREATCDKMMQQSCCCFGVFLSLLGPGPI